MSGGGGSKRNLIEKHRANRRKKWDGEGDRDTVRGK
jgi:hypothetical protein